MFEPPDMTENFQQVALGRYDQQNNYSMELFLCYYASKKKEKG
jgi:hypothetical protein